MASLISIDPNVVPVAADQIQRWPDLWMAIAYTIARKSKDPRCPVGAVVVRDDLPLTVGFNGLPRAVEDDPAVLGDVEEKLRCICHAEENAICNAARAGISLKGATIYVTKFPCLACCKLIIQSGIARVYTDDTKFWDDDPDDKEHTRKIRFLRQAKIEVDAPFHPQFAKHSVKKIVTIDGTSPATIRAL